MELFKELLSLLTLSFFFRDSWEVMISSICSSSPSSNSGLFPTDDSISCGVLLLFVVIVSPGVLTADVSDASRSNDGAFSDGTFDNDEKCGGGLKKLVVSGSVSDGWGVDASVGGCIIDAVGVGVS